MEDAILVTGGAGFIGSTAIAALLGEGARIVCVDNFSDDYDPALKRKNIKPFLGNENFTLIEADIRDKKIMEKAFRKGKFAKVLHLAARAGVRQSIAQPELYEDINVRGTLNMLDAAKAHGVKDFVFASSSSIYGATKNIPFKEGDGGIAVSPYAVTKRAGELYCSYYSRAYDMNCACLRYFTVYGPGQRPALAIHKFTRLISEGMEVPIYGDGSSARDYTYVSDIVRGTLAALEFSGKNRGFQIINLGNSRPVNIMELVGLIEKELGKKANVRHVQEQAGDVKVTHADISKAGRLLGYEPKMKIEEGIGKFVEWYNSGGK
ncbi:MAG: NAD-dependent epimerase/dehydratase family protein [Candidatus Diapherotrites archaeon]